MAARMNFDLQDVKIEASGSYTPALEGELVPFTHFTAVNIVAHLKTSETRQRIRQLQDKTEKLCPMTSLFKAANIPITSEWKKVELQQ